MPLNLTSKRRSATTSWLDVVWKAVHQLSVVYSDREYFHYYQDICQYIETHWQRLARGKDRTSTWTNTVSSTITTHKKIFKPGPEHGYWGLRQHPHDDTPMEILLAIRDQMVGSAEPARRSDDQTAVGESSYGRKRKSGSRGVEKVSPAKRTGAIYSASRSAPALRYEATLSDDEDDDCDSSSSSSSSASRSLVSESAASSSSSEELIDIEGNSEADSEVEALAAPLPAAQDDLEDSTSPYLVDIFKPSYLSNNGHYSDYSEFSDPLTCSDSLWPNEHAALSPSCDAELPAPTPLQEDWLQSVLA